MIVIVITIMTRWKLHENLCKTWIECLNQNHSTKPPSYQTTTGDIWVGWSDHNLLTWIPDIWMNGEMKHQLRLWAAFLSFERLQIRTVLTITTMIGHQWLYFVLKTCWQPSLDSLKSWHLIMIHLNIKFEIWDCRFISSNSE